MNKLFGLNLEDIEYKQIVGIPYFHIIKHKGCSIYVTCSEHSVKYEVRIFKDRNQVFYGLFEEEPDLSKLNL